MTAGAGGSGAAATAGRGVAARTVAVTTDKADKLRKGVTERRLPMMPPKATNPRFPPRKRLRFFD
ncbi:hypothetical protein GCM10010149_05820 [Nonomuraea roseoviolacea subsp. roseoviolacea]